MSVSVRDHAAAIKAQLEADPVLAGCTFRGKVTGQPQRYCRFTMTSGLRFARRQTGPAVSADFTVTVYSAGVDPDQAQAVAERVFAQLLGFSPTVDGRRCTRLAHAAAGSEADDDSVLPGLVYVPNQFSFTSDPA